MSAKQQQKSSASPHFKKNEEKIVEKIIIDIEGIKVFFYFWSIF